MGDAVIVVFLIMLPCLLVLGSLWLLYKYYQLRKTIEKITRELDKLGNKKAEVQLIVDKINRDLRIVRLDAEVWIKRATDNEERAYKILQDNKSRRCLNLISLFRLNTKAKKLKRDIFYLLKDANITQDIANELLNEEEESDKISHPPNIGDTFMVDVDAISARPQLCRRFTFAEMQSATQNFSNAFLIGKGGFGKVYKGFIDNGATMVAIKRLDPASNQGATEFQTEIEMLSQFRHCNLVSLIGCCEDAGEMILVYEFMPNGTMADHLHPKFGNRRSGNTCILSWVQRLKICIGAARGIHYLHTGTGVLQSIIHRDVKTSNILLDENWAAKVSDFGLSRIGPANQSCTHISTRVKGTPGYCDPDYFLTHRLTKKSDVYAFGVVLFEVLSGKPALDLTLPKGKWYLATRAKQSIQENTTHQLIDPNLKWEISDSSLKAFVDIAGQCLRDDSKNRPKMVEVVASLELVLKLQMDKISSTFRDDIFGFGETNDVEDSSIQNPREGVGNNNYKESVKQKRVVQETEMKNDENGGTSTKNRWCRSCGEVEACVMLLPCRHLCVCTKCDFLLKACPICNSAKETSLTVNRFS